MKYIITESQLDKVIFGYLNRQKFHVINRNNDFIFWNREDIETRNFDAEIIISTHKQIYCFIKQDLIETISTFFSLEESDAMNIISDWVESKTGFDFKNILRV